MRSKDLFILIIVNSISCLLILIIHFLPETTFRTLLGIPFIMFFPGFTLYTAIFPPRKEIEPLEVIAISIAFSIAVVALISIILNYTSAGITLVAQLLSIEGFIIVTSIVAMIRKYIYFQQWGFYQSQEWHYPADFEYSKVNKYLSAAVFLCITAFIGILIFSVASPKTREAYTEFYLLSPDGTAGQYPIEYVMDNGSIDLVTYSNGATVTDGIQESIILGIVNHEQRAVTYSISVMVNNKPGSLSQNSMNATLNSFTVDSGEKLEQAVQFIPDSLGEDQKVEFLLYKDSNYQTPANSLHFWVSVKANSATQ